MSSVRVTEHTDKVVLTVDGDFTFELNREFREAYKAHAGKRCFEVDLTSAHYMDSAGLGMLVQLREFAGGENACVSITGTNGTIQSILEVANFERLFRLSA